MTISEVRDKVEEELRRGDSFNNSHGITKENIRRFLVEPYEVIGPTTAKPYVGLKNSGCEVWDGI